LPEQQLKALAIGSYHLGGRLYAKDQRRFPSLRGRENKDGGIPGVKNNRGRDASFTEALPLTVLTKEKTLTRKY